MFEDPYSIECTELHTEQRKKRYIHIGSKTTLFLARGGNIIPLGSDYVFVSKLLFPNGSTATLIDRTPFSCKPTLRYLSSKAIMNSKHEPIPPIAIPDLEYSTLNISTHIFIFPNKCPAKCVRDAVINLNDDVFIIPVVDKVPNSLILLDSNAMKALTAIKDADITYTI